MYIPNNLLLYKSQQSYEGMFNKNPYPNIINGSLWTIPYEFTFYIIISVLIPIKHNKKKALTLLLLLFVVLFVGKIFFIDIVSKLAVHAMNGRDFTELGLFFIAGSILALLDIDKRGNKNILLYLSLLVLCMSVLLNQFDLIQFLTLPLIIIIFGLKNTKYISNINVLIGADLSYGLYIYSFPVQQTLVYFFKLNPIQLFVYSLSISIILSYLSWNLIEKRALQLKKSYTNSFGLKNAVIN